MFQPEVECTRLAQLWKNMIILKHMRCQEACCSDYRDMPDALQKKHDPLLAIQSNRTLRIGTSAPIMLKENVWTDDAHAVVYGSVTIGAGSVVPRTFLQE